MSNFGAIITLWVVFQGEIDAAVKTLLELKAQYKSLTGEDFPAPGKAPSKPRESKPKEKVAKQKATQKEKSPVDVSG